LNFNWDGLKKLAKKKNIAIYLTKERSGGEFEAIRMGFGGFRIEEIEEAVDAFAKVLSQIV